MKRFFIPLLTLFLLLNLNILAQDGWLLQDGNSERTAYVDSDMKPPFILSQTYDLTRDVEGFTYAYGMIYFFHGGQSGNTVGAFDPGKGEIIWTRKVTESTGANGCFPAVSDNIIYAAGQRAKVIYALDRMTGDSLWSHPTGSNYGRSFAIKGDKFFVQPADYGMVCIQKDTGEVLWEYGKASAQTVPLVDDKHAYFTSRLNDTIVALTHDGEVVWKYVSLSPIDDFESLLSKGDTVFFKSRGYLVALNQANGEEYWSTKLGSDTSFIATVNALTWTPEMLIVHEWDGDWRGAFKIQGFDMKNGNMVWSHDLEDASGTPATAFGKYLVHVNGGDLQIRRASDGEVIQEFTGEGFYNWARVIVVDGMILASKRSEIVVLTPEPTSVRNEDKFPFEWKILGNPVSENLTLEIRTENPEEITYRVIGTDGKMTAVNGRIFTSEISKVSIDLSNIATGNYIIQLLYQGQTDQKMFFLSDHP